MKNLPAGAERSDGPFDSSPERSEGREIPPTLAGRGYLSVLLLVELQSLGDEGLDDCILELGRTLVSDDVDA